MQKEVWSLVFHYGENEEKFGLLHSLNFEVPLLKYLCGEEQQAQAQELLQPKFTDREKCIEWLSRYCSIVSVPFIPEFIITPYYADEHTSTDAIELNTLGTLDDEQLWMTTYLCGLNKWRRLQQFTEQGCNVIVFCAHEEEERDWTLTRLVPSLFIYSGSSLIEHFSRLCSSIRQQQLQQQLEPAAIVIYNYFSDDLAETNLLEAESKDKVIRCTREHFLESSMDLPVKIFFLTPTDLPTSFQAQVQAQTGEALNTSKQFEFAAVHQQHQF